MDCTTTGWADPSGTEATRVVTVVRRFVGIIDFNIGQDYVTAEWQEY